MNASRSLAALGGLALCIALGLLLLGGPSVAQPPAAPLAVNGRYQVAVKPMGTTTTVFLVDTQTGQCWYRDTNPATKDWTDMGLPAPKPGR